jgi:hypothetical protein
MADLTGRRRFAQLYRRAGFGATPAELDAAIARDPDENVAFSLAVDDLLNYPDTDVDDRFQPDPNVPDTLIRWWLERMIRTRRPLLEKIDLLLAQPLCDGAEQGWARRAQDAAPE